MNRLGGSGLLISAIIMIVLGVILRWDLIDWIIDVTGLLLIVLGAVLLVISLVSLVVGGGRRRASRY